VEISKGNGAKEKFENFSVQKQKVPCGKNHNKLVYHIIGNLLKAFDGRSYGRALSQ